jgi:hypothetical protein
MFGPKKNEIVVSLGEYVVKNFVKVHRSLGVVRIVKSRQLRWAGHAARIEETEGVCIMLVENHLRNRQDKREGNRKKITLRWISEKLIVRIVDGRSF